MAQLKRYNGTSWETIGGTVTGDTLPIGSEVDYDGTSVPAGWEEIDDPNTYSTSETKIGTWIDGKPLYRSIIVYTTTSVIGASGSQTDINIAHSISNLKTCVKSSGILYYPGSEGIVKPLPQISGSTSLTSSTVIREVNGTNIILRITNDTWTHPIIHFILEYTKTTD